jgi:hypothetical protein
MKEIKWGFIGCGEVTEKKSGPAFSLIEGSSVVAVMSRSSEKARSYAQRHGIKRWYTDPQALLDDPDVNAVYIATPPTTHATFAFMAKRCPKRFVLGFTESGKFYFYSKTLQQLMSSGYVYLVPCVFN